MKIVDLSKPVIDNPKAPSFLRIKIKPMGRTLARWMIWSFGLPWRYFPKGFEGWAGETIQKLGTHSTTHIDAPIHYGSMSGGAPAEGIDKIPLEKCIGPGIVLDMSHKPEGEAITVAEVQAELARIDAVVTAGTIVLVRTDRDKFHLEPDFWKRGTGMSAEATEWLIDQGSIVMGIDQWGWDIPLHVQIARSKAEKRNDLFWEAHRVGIRKTFWHMEQLTNLDKLPSKGFQVIVMPLKLVGASASPARVVAILD